MGANTGTEMSILAFIGSYDGITPRLGAWVSSTSAQLHLEDWAVRLAKGYQPSRSSGELRLMVVRKAGRHASAAAPRSSNSRIDRGAKTQRAPNHISKTVLSTVHFGPPAWTRTDHWG